MDNEQRKNFHDMYILDDNSRLFQIVQTFPLSLIKFFNDSNYNLNALKQQKIWFSSPHYFNDPFDCAVNIDFVDAAYKDLIEMNNNLFNKESSDILFDINDPNIKSFLKIHAQKRGNTYLDNATNVTNSIFISCLTEINNLGSLIMWGHYANSHKGFCLEYDIRDFMMNYDDFQIIPVYYSNNYSFNWHTETECDMRKFKLALAFTKAYEWYYELEWRLMNTSIEQSGNNGFLLPFLKPKRVYLGCKMDKDFKKDLIFICIQKNIAIYEGFLIPNTYNIAFKKFENK